MFHLQIFSWDFLCVHWNVIKYWFYYGESSLVIILSIIVILLKSLTAGLTAGILGLSLRVASWLV